jgi:PAS domain S-box-containing protein
LSEFDYTKKAPLFYKSLRGIPMLNHGSHQELQRRVEELEKEAVKGINAQKALERKITELDSFINNIPDMAWIKDAESRLVVANEAFANAAGMAPESLINHTCEVCFGKEEAERFREDDLAVMKSGKQKILEEKIVDSENREIWLETIKSPILDEWGKVIGTVGIARDITKRKLAEESLRKAQAELERKVEERTIELVTKNEELRREAEERKQAEEALRESKERYSLATRAARVGVWDWDVRTRKFYLDPNVKAILGYADEEIPNDLDVWAISVYPDDRQPVMEAFQAHMEGQTPEFVYEHRMVHKDGSIRWILARGTALRDPQGNPIRVVGTDTDITMRKQAELEREKLEAKLQESQKMEAVGTLAGGIAHDFNNLLMSIQGAVSLMLFNIKSTDPYYEMLNKVQSEIGNGAKLTQQLLGYARKGRYVIRPIDLNRLVKDTSDTFGRTKKEITIYQDLAEDLSAIEADESQIEQIVLNIYVNAWQAMPNGGDLFVKTANATHEDMAGRIYDPKPQNYVLLEVTDTGTGMNEKTKERIFDPFFTTKEMGRGTGLGLASVYGIVKGHGGYIDVESEEDHGSTFSIYLPASEKEVARTAEVARQITQGKGTILFVDDEERVLNIGTKILEKLGFDVLEARSGKEAVEVYKENKDRIDMVLLDMIMPEMNGKAVYEKMKEIDPNVKVLLSSGYSIEGLATEILDRGCDGFIQKPFTLSELSERVTEILGKNRDN